MYIHTFISKYNRCMYMYVKAYLYALINVKFVLVKNSVLSMLNMFEMLNSLL